LFKLFIDESYRRDHYYVAGVLVNERQERVLTDRLDYLAYQAQMRNHWKYSPEFHGHALMNGLWRLGWPARALWCLYLHISIGNALGPKFRCPGISGGRGYKASALAISLSTKPTRNHLATSLRTSQWILRRNREENHSSKSV